MGRRHFDLCIFIHQSRANILPEETPERWGCCDLHQREIEARQGGNALGSVHYSRPAGDANRERERPETGSVCAVTCGFRSKSCRILERGFARQLPCRPDPNN